MRVAGEWFSREESHSGREESIRIGETECDRKGREGPRTSGLDEKLGGGAGIHPSIYARALGRGGVGGGLRFTHFRVRLFTGL